MSGSGEWDKRMTETLKNFDLNSPEVKQQFGNQIIPPINCYKVLYYSMVVA